MKVCFTGTQKKLSPKQLEDLESRLDSLKPSALIHGGCVGGDDAADLIAAKLNIYRVIYPCNIPGKSLSFELLRARGKCTIYLPRMYPLDRNRVMVSVADFLIAYPRQEREYLRSGTWATIRYARKARLPHWVIGPSGRRIE
jgi:hypothetical protein